MSILLETSNLFRTFKTQKEVAEYIDQHIPEEKKLLWMGFMFGCNYSANQVNENFILKKKLSWLWIQETPLKILRMVIFNEKIHNRN